MAVEGYHDATIEQAILALDNKVLIKKINELAIKKNCQISICHYRNNGKKNLIQFSAESIDRNKTTTLFDTSEISAFISDEINYDDVSVNFKDEFELDTFENVFEDVTLFVPENYDNIQKFLRQHYPECYREIDAVVHQDKRQRSVSPPHSSTFFPGNGSSQQDDAKLPTPEMVEEHLKQATWWPELQRTSPEKAAAVIDQGCGRAKRALTQDQTINSRPTGAAK